MDKLIGTLDNKIIMLIAAGVLGITGNQILIQAKPEIVRPDPFTAKQAQELERRLRAYVDLKVLPHDQHLTRAEKGWEWIYEMRSDIRQIKRELGLIKKEVTAIENNNGN